MTWRAVSLDRGGVINANRSDFVKSWEEFEFLPPRWRPWLSFRTFHKTVVVTNQSGDLWKKSLQVRKRRRIWLQDMENMVHGDWSDRGHSSGRLYRLECCS